MNIIFFTKEEAISFARKNQITEPLPYYDSGSLFSLERKMAELENKKDEYIQRKYMHMTGFTKCSNCKSRINTAYIRLERFRIDGIEATKCPCPVCENELRKNRVVNKERKYIEKIIKVKQEIKDLGCIKYLSA